jgi:hypothetical protein
MSQEDRPKFSHITVGQTTDDEPMLPDDEEVISIGAVNDDAPGASAANPLDANAAVDANAAAIAAAAASSGRAADADAGESLPGQRTPSTSKGGTRTAVDERPSATDADDIDGLNEPMPLAQRIVVAGSAVGLIIVIAFLVWYWVIA